MGISDGAASTSGSILVTVVVAFTSGGVGRVISDVAKGSFSISSVSGISLRIFLCYK